MIDEENDENSGEESEWEKNDQTVFIFPTTVAHRIDKDSPFYEWGPKDILNSTDHTWLSYFVEIFMKWLEAFYDTGPIDLIGDLVVTHIVYYKKTSFSNVTFTGERFTYI